MEHPPHSFDLRCVPITNVLIKRRIVERRLHIGYGASIPVADITVEVSPLKQSPQIFHVADIPAGDVLVEASRSIKHLFQTNQIVDIQVANSYATFTEHPTERTLATA